MWNNGVVASAPSTVRALEDLATGERIWGRVVFVGSIGTWFDIGADKEGLMPTRLYPKQDLKLGAGDEVTGLRVHTVDLGSQRFTLDGTHAEIILDDWER